MATAAAGKQVTEWDERGQPITAKPATTQAQEWDERGNPVGPNAPAVPTPTDVQRLSDTGASPRLVEMVKSGAAQIPEGILHPPGVSTEPPKTWGQAAWQTGKNIVSGMASMAWKGLRGMTVEGGQENAQEAAAALTAEKQRMADRRSGPSPYNPVYRTLAPVTDLVPIFPANAAQMEESAKRGDMKQLATDTGAGLAMAASPYLAEPISRATGAVVRPLVREAGNAADIMTPEFVKRYTQPEAGQAVTRAVQPGANIPRFDQSKDIVGPRIQQLKQDGLLANAQGEPLTEIKTPDDVLAATKAVKAHIWDHVEKRLGPVDDYMADTTPIAAAMKATITDRTRQQYPQLAAALEKRADTYLTPRPLRAIEDGIQDANNDLRNYYKRPMPTDSPIGPDTAATEAEVSAARQLLDQKVSDLRGAGVADLKREYGAARDMERAAARAKIVADRQKGVPLYEGLAMLRAAGEVVSGNVLGAAKSGMTMAVGRYLTNLRSPEFLINQAFQGKHAFPAAAPIADLPPHMPTPVQGAPAILAEDRQLPAASQASPANRQLPAPGPAIITPPPADTSGTPAVPETGPQKVHPAPARPEAQPQAPPNAGGIKEPVGLRTSAEQGILVPKSPVLRPEDKLLTGPGGTAEGPGSAPPTQEPPKPGQPQGRNGPRPVKPMQGRATPAKTPADAANRPAAPNGATPAKPMTAGRVTLQGIAAMTDREALEQIITDHSKSPAMREAASNRSKQIWQAGQPKPEAPPASAEPPLEKIKGSSDAEYLNYIQGNGKLSQPLRDAASARIEELNKARQTANQHRAGLETASAQARENRAQGRSEQNIPAEAPPAKPLQRPGPVKDRYPAALVAHAEGQMKGALELAQNFERPGRYMDIYTEQGNDQAFNAGRDYNFRGVKSSHHHVAAFFPWYNGEGMSMSALRDAVAKGKGLGYERIMQQIIDFEEPGYRPSQAVSQQPEPIADVSKPTEEPAKEPGDLLYQFNGQGEQKGIHVDMTAHQNGYAVTVIDEDSGQALPHVTIYKDRAQAFEAARKIAHGEVPKAEPAGVLPGMGEHVAAQKAGAAKVQGEQMTAELQKPLGSIESKAGEMERNSPLFRGTDASPQKEIFGNEPPKKPPKMKR